jgi:hypothetical protein
VVDAQKGKFDAEWPMGTALGAVARALVTYVNQHLTQDELNRRRSTWSSGRLGLRY